MRYALKRSDGSVAIMMVLPSSVQAEDGRVFTGLRIDRQDGETRIRGSSGTDTLAIRLTTLPEDLVPDTLGKGWTLDFPSVESCIAKWPADKQAEIVSTHKITSADIPEDRQFRDALMWTGARIAHDMGKARALHCDRLREARAPRLETLDVAYSQADEKGDAREKAAIATKKQTLRDLTAHPAIAKAKTVEALAALTIDALLVP